MNRLEGKTALITGASRGIGRAVAVALLGAGYSVALAGRRREGLDGTIAEAGGDGARALAGPTDVGKADDVAAVFERTKEFGVMKALGTPRWQIVSMIVWEGVWMAVLGVGLGVLLAALLTTYLHGVGVQLSDQPFEFGGMSISTIHPANTVLGTVIYPSILVIASILGAIWPAWRASNLDPVAALREL